jgi:hypothetical protein
VVLALIDGVVYVPPVARATPPVAAAYQLMVPVDVPDSVLVPEPQMDVAVTLLIAGAFITFTVTIGPFILPQAPPDKAAR